MAGGDPLDALEATLGYRFDRRALLEEALTHASVAGTRGGSSLERLEFLGDRVLGLAVARLLMRRFPDENQGSLAKRLALLVSHDALVGVARGLELSDSIRVESGVAASGGDLPPSILEDVLEAVIGAVFLDGGLEAAQELVEVLWTPLLTTSPPRDAKTTLQEWAQGRALPLPAYHTVQEEGPAHEPIFTVEVAVEGFDPARATAGSKRGAEQAAAAELLERIGESDG